MAGVAGMLALWPDKLHPAAQPACPKALIWTRPHGVLLCSADMQALLCCTASMSRGAAGRSRINPCSRVMRNADMQAMPG